MNHKCIRCKKPYNDSDEEDYLCNECNQSRLALAREIDAKVGSTVGQKPNSTYQQYEKLRVTKGIRGFVNAKDLGI